MTGDAVVTEIDQSVVDALKAFALDVVPFFEGLSPSDLVVSSVKGGTTNQLYLIRRVTLAEGGDGGAEASNTDKLPTAVVVRVYGKDTDKIISRDEELFWQGQFLETYGSNKEMLAYEFLEGFRALKPHEFYSRRHQIARRVAAFHAKATQSSIYRMPTSLEVENQTMVMLKKWINYVSDIDRVRSLVAPGKQELFDKMGWADGGLIRERDWLLSVIEKNIRKLPVAVCHNDLTCGNFMVNETQGREELRFIDFEYTRLNFTYFDIANHFCEYGGLECDFSKFPERSVVSEFIREYLQEGRKRNTIAGYIGMNDNDAPRSTSSQNGATSSPSTATTAKPSSPLTARPRFDFGTNTFDFAATPPHGSNADTPTTAAVSGLHLEDKILAPISPNHHHTSVHATPFSHKGQQKSQHDKLLTVSDEEVKDATDLVLFFALISHFGWSIWGLIQEQVSEIDFGFMDYAWARWEEYTKRKEEFSRNVA